MKNKTFIIIGGVVLVALLIVATILPGKEKKEEKIKVDLLGINYEIEGNEAELNFGETNPVVAMNIEKYGSVVIELYPSVAPNTVNNFISLVKSGFYDNNSFHRLMPGFVLQGGDPTGSGSGGPGYTIKGEFTNNGFTNDLSNTITHNGIAIGTNNIANGNSSIAEGNSTSALHIKSHSGGEGTKTGADYQTVIGKFNQSTVGQFVIGSGTDDATRSNAMVVNGSTTFIENLDGNNTTVNNLVVNSSVTLPADMTGTMQNLQIGNADDNGNLTVIGKIQHGDGTSAMSVANGNYAHAQGYNTRAEGNYSHSEGISAKSVGSYTHAEGNNTVAQGTYSHAEGNNTVAQGAYSHAEGNNSTLYSDAYGAHVEGNGAQIIQGTYAHAEGTGCIISGDGHYGHAEGVHTTVLHQGGHAGGHRTRTSENYQTVIGEYNADEEGQFIVGCGTSDDARANAMVVNGNTTNINKLVAKSIDAGNVTLDGKTPMLLNTYYTAKINSSVNASTSITPFFGTSPEYAISFTASPYISELLSLTLTNCTASSINDISINYVNYWDSYTRPRQQDMIYKNRLTNINYNENTKVLSFQIGGMPSWYSSGETITVYLAKISVTYPITTSAVETKTIMFTSV